MDSIGFFLGFVIITALWTIIYSLLVIIIVFMWSSIFYGIRMLLWTIKGKVKSKPSFYGTLAVFLIVSASLAILLNFALYKAVVINNIELIIRIISSIMQIIFGYVLYNYIQNQRKEKENLLTKEGEK